MNLQEFLARKGIAFEVIKHPPTSDAQRMAHAVHAPGSEVAKTVLLRANQGREYVVAVLPATYDVDFEQARKALGDSALELANEDDVAARCPDCEVGALPPFGSQYQMKTLVDEKLAEKEEIFFEGNTHDETIHMKFSDFRKLEDPIVASFARRK